MEQQKNVAIIHRDSNIADLLATVTQELGHKASTMIVNKDTLPQDVASFVKGLSSLDLVLLAENYLDYNDPAVRAYYTQRDYKIDIAKVKVGEGIEALVEIRKNHPDLPVFMVSADPKHREEAMRGGANGYLILPVGLKQYEDFLKRAFESSTRNT